MTAWTALTLAALLYGAVCATAEACTLWGAAGSATVAGGGTLVAKNRDWEPDHRQELVLVRPAGGYATLVLKAIGGREPGVKAGVNAQGLVLVSASANQVPEAARKRIPQASGALSRLLATCASVAEVLERLDGLTRPVFYLAADRREVALIEVAPDGRKAVTRRETGCLHHTNHYAAIETPGAARRPTPSSLARQARIAQLLEAAPRPLALEDFIRFSSDRSAGPDDSLWRTGGTPQKTRTLASWIVSIPAEGGPLLYLKTADPGQPERFCRLAVEPLLRHAAPGAIALDGTPCEAPPEALPSP